MRLPLIRPLSPETIRLLHRIHRYSRHHQVRQRAQFLILYNQRKSLSQLIPIFWLLVKPFTTGSMPGNLKDS